MRQSRVLSVFLSAALVGAQVPVFAQSARVSVDLAAGMRQVEEGDFDSAIVTLNRVVKSLASERGASKDLAKAYLYIAIANLGLSQETAAKARLLDALSADKSLSLSPDEYPPNVIQLFNQVRREAGIATTAPQAPTREAPPAVKKGGSKLPWILGGAGAGVVLLGLAAKSKKKDENNTPNPGTLVIENKNVIPIASVSEALFRVDGASDPDGDPLYFYWMFGDESETEGGSTISHIYKNAGEYVVKVNVSDGKKDVTIAGNLRVKSLTGKWNGSVQGYSVVIQTDLQQTGSDIRGTYSLGSLNGAVAGSVRSDRGVVLAFNVQGYAPIMFKGTVLETADRMSGVLTESGFNGEKAEFAR